MSAQGAFGDVGTSGSRRARAALGLASALVLGAALGCASTAAPPEAAPQTSRAPSSAAPAEPTPSAAPCEPCAAARAECAALEGAGASDASIRIGRARLSRAEADGWRREIAVSSDVPASGRSGEARAAAVAPGPFKALRTIPFGKSHLTFAEMSSDGSWVVAASEAEGVLRQYDAASGRLLAALAAPGFEAFGRASFSAWPLAGNEPQVLEVDEHGHRLLDLRAGTVTELDSEPAWVTRESESGRYLGSMLARIESQTSTLRFARPTAAPALEPLLHLSLAERADDWVLSRDARRLALLFYPSDQIELLDLDARRVVLVVPAPKYASSIDFTPDERFLAVGGAALWIYDLETGQRVASDERFDNNIGHVGFSPGGETLLVTAYDGRARSYPFSDGRLGERQVLSHRGTANVYAAELSSDGRRLVTSSGDQTLKVWQR